MVGEKSVDFCTYLLWDGGDGLGGWWLLSSAWKKLNSTLLKQIGLNKL